jgi:hypothetical protein
MFGEAKEGWFDPQDHGESICSDARHMLTDL